MLESIDGRMERPARADQAMLVAAELLSNHPWMTPWELRTTLRERGLHAEPAQLEAAIARARRDVLRPRLVEPAANGAARRPWWRLWG